MVRAKRKHESAKNNWTLRHWAILAGLFILVAIVSFAVLGMGASITLRIAKASTPAQTTDEPSDTRPVPLRLSRTVRVVASAYSSHADQTDGSPCITANGFDLCQNYIETQAIDSVATNGLPFGTVVRFPGLFPHLTFVVRDRMNARYGSNFVDIWLPYRADASTFGRRVLEMEIYEPAP